jgi:hypothetical protein
MLHGPGDYPWRDLGVELGPLEDDLQYWELWEEYGDDPRWDEPNRRVRHVREGRCLDDHNSFCGSRDED